MTSSSAEFVKLLGKGFLSIWPHLYAKSTFFRPFKYLCLTVVPYEGLSNLCLNLHHVHRFCVNSAIRRASRGKCHERYWNNTCMGPKCKGFYSPLRAWRDPPSMEGSTERGGIPRGCRRPRGGSRHARWIPTCEVDPDMRGRTVKSRTLRPHACIVPLQC